MKITIRLNSFKLFLRRRANTWGEEIRAPNFERECLEETCSRGELIEIYKKGIIFYVCTNYVGFNSRGGII